jgi:hypothetical protein
MQKVRAIVLFSFILLLASCNGDVDPSEIIDDTITEAIQEQLSIPVINGAKDIDYTIGDPLPDYLDGVSASDTEYGDITNTILVNDDSVNYQTVGEYPVYYQITNSDGNYAFSSITVTVSMPNTTIVLDETFFIVQTNDTYGIVNNSGEEVLPMIYDSISYLNEGILYLKLYDNEVYYDINSSTYLDFDHTPIWFEDGISAYRQGDQYGYMTIDNVVLTQALFDQAQPFEYGKAIVQSNGLYGAIDASGALVLPFRYSELVTGIDFHIGTIDGETYLLDDHFTIINDLYNASLELYGIKNDFVYGVNTSDGLLLLEKDLSFVSMDDYSPIYVVDTKLINNELLYLVKTTTGNHLLLPDGTIQQAYEVEQLNDISYVPNLDLYLLESSNLLAFLSNDYQYLNGMNATNYNDVEQVSDNTFNIDGLYDYFLHYDTETGMIYYFKYDTVDMYYGSLVYTDDSDNIYVINGNDILMEKAENFSVYEMEDSLLFAFFNNDTSSIYDYSDSMFHYHSSGEGNVYAWDTYYTRYTNIYYFYDKDGQVLTDGSNFVLALNKDYIGLYLGNSTMQVLNINTKELLPDTYSIMLLNFNITGVDWYYNDDYNGLLKVTKYIEDDTNVAQVYNDTSQLVFDQNAMVTHLINDHFLLYRDIDTDTIIWYNFETNTPMINQIASYQYTSDGYFSILLENDTHPFIVDENLNLIYDSLDDFPDIISSSLHNRFLEIKTETMTYNYDFRNDEMVTGDIYTNLNNMNDFYFTKYTGTYSIYTYLNNNNVNILFSVASYPTLEGPFILFDDNSVYHYHDDMILENVDAIYGGDGYAFIVQNNMTHVYTYDEDGYILEHFTADFTVNENTTLVDNYIVYTHPTGINIYHPNENGVYNLTLIADELYYIDDTVLIVEYHGYTRVFVRNLDTQYVSSILNLPKEYYNKDTNSFQYNNLDITLQGEYLVVSSDPYNYYTRLIIDEDLPYIIGYTEFIESMNLLFANDAVITNVKDIPVQLSDTLFNAQTSEFIMNDDMMYELRDTTILFDKDGEIIRYSCDQITPYLDTTFFQIESLNSIGIINSEGELIVPALYETISYENGFFIATTGNVIYIYSETGQLILEPYNDLDIIS